MAVELDWFFDELGQSKDAPRPDDGTAAAGGRSAVAALVMSGVGQSTRRLVWFAIAAAAASGLLVAVFSAVGLSSLRP